MFYHLYYCLKKKVDNDFRRHILGASIQHGLYSGINDDIMSLHEDMNILWNSLYSFWNVIFNCLENYFIYADTCITLNKKSCWTCGVIDLNNKEPWNSSTYFG